MIPNEAAYVAAFGLGLLGVAPAWLAGKVAGMKLRDAEKASLWQFAYLGGVLDKMSGAYGRGEGIQNPYRGTK